MIIAFASNYLNHHQLPLALAFFNRPDVTYYFLAFEPTPQSRIQMGYKEMNDAYPFVIKAYESVEQKQKALQIIQTADIFISSISDEHIRLRLKTGKRVYRFSERFYKTYGKKTLRTSSIHFFLSAIRHVLPFSKKNVVYLAASAYLANDLQRFVHAKNTVLRWGYFPNHKIISQQEIIAAKNKGGKIKCLWVGRLIRLKHPEIALESFINVAKSNENLELTIVGEGPMESELKNMVKHYDISEKISFKKFMNFEEVREEMVGSHIFLFTSDESEGWGAVLNEAMDSGCACIASLSAGSTPFLIKNGVNGYAYAWDDKQTLIRHLTSLASSHDLRAEMGMQARETIEKEWNAETAAAKLLEFDAGKRFENGVCSIVGESK